MQEIFGSRAWVICNAFEAELVGLKFSKGAIQFSLDNPIPKELIQKIVLFRLEEIETMMQEK